LENVEGHEHSEQFSIPYDSSTDVGKCCTCRRNSMHTGASPTGQRLRRPGTEQPRLSWYDRGNHEGISWPPLPLRAYQLQPRLCACASSESV